MMDLAYRFGWYAEWRKSADGAIRGLKLNKVPNLNVLRSLSEGDIIFFSLLVLLIVCFQCCISSFVIACDISLWLDIF